MSVNIIDVEENFKNSEKRRVETAKSNAKTICQEIIKYYKVIAGGTAVISAEAVLLATGNEIAAGVALPTLISIPTVIKAIKEIKEKKSELYNILDNEIKEKDVETVMEEKGFKKGEENGRSK